MKDQMQPLKEFFNDIDKDFVGIKKVEDDVFIYNASDVLVQAIWELPIVIQWPDSVVNYKFNSQHGDISFGIMFVAAPEEDDPEVEDLEVETVEDICRVPSSTENIEGSFQVPYEGVIFFLWDNNFDWSSVKKLSYHIEVKQPSFTVPDEIRAAECMKELRILEEKLDALYIKRADAQSVLEHNSANVSFLEDHVEILQQKLRVKRDDLLLQENEIKNTEEIVLLSDDTKLGLCIRSLHRSILSVVFTFLKEDLSYLLVCKYWRDIFIENHRLITADLIIPSKALMKLPKAEIKRQLYEIRLQKKYPSTHHISSNDSQHSLIYSTSSHQQSDNSHHKSHGISNNQSKAELLVERIDSDCSNVSDDSISLDGQLISSNQNNVNNHAVKSHIQISMDHLLPAQNLMVKTKQQEESDRNGRRRNFKSFSQYKANLLKEDGLTLLTNGVANDSNNIPNKNLEKSGTKKDLLQHLLKIRTQQQLDSVIEYLNAGFNKIDQLNAEKRRIKKLIHAWNVTYQKQHQRLPTSSERKGQLRELHEEYQQISVALRIRKEKMDEALKKIGMTKEDFEEIRSSKY